MQNRIGVAWQGWESPGKAWLGEARTGLAWIGRIGLDKVNP